MSSSRNHGRPRIIPGPGRRIIVLAAIDAIVALGVAVVALERLAHH